MNRRKGFTLVELMVVILILAVLAALVVPRVIGHAEDAKRARAASDLSTFHGALMVFRLACDRFPTTDEGLDALMTAPKDLENKWRGPYVEKLPPDPWGQPYVYTYPGKSGTDFDISSDGPDGQPGTADDVYDTPPTQ